MIHLDTSFLIKSLQPHSREDRLLRRWITSSVPIRLSAISWAEFLCGPISDDQAVLAAELLDQIVPFDTAHAGLAAKLFNASGRRRGTMADCMIAAAAIGDGAKLATSNPRDFLRLESSGLEVVGP